MDTEAMALSAQVAKKIRPAYQIHLKRGQGSDEAFASTYEEAVRVVAQARNMSVEKTRFFSTDVLQAVMNLVTR
jgi:hypothetical protein